MVVVVGRCAFIVMLVLEVEVKVVLMSVVVNVDSILVGEGGRWY